jgi:hypothetical protein
MIYLANLQMQMTCSDQPCFLVQNFAQMQEKEREFTYYKIVHPFLKKKIAIFRDVLKGFCHFVT